MELKRSIFYTSKDSSFLVADYNRNFPRHLLFSREEISHHQLNELWRVASRNYNCSQRTRTIYTAGYKFVSFVEGERVGNEIRPIF